jgi:hypothetical protein
MVMRGRTMEGYIRVDAATLNERALRTWLKLAVAFVQTLPAKAPNPQRARSKRKST